MLHERDRRSNDQRRKTAVILGTNEIASAIAAELVPCSYDVVMSHDPIPPVIRRKMAFHDALFGDPVTLNGVSAMRVDDAITLRGSLGMTNRVLITELGLLDLIVIQTLDVLIDARLQKYVTKPDLRRLARSTIGLGPGFIGEANCDIAVETLPARAGELIIRGPTAEPDGRPAPLGEARETRFVRAEINGRWHTAVEIGARIYRNFVVGHLAGIPVHAPFDGLLRGVVRDGVEVPAGAKLLEIDPRGRAASDTELDERTRRIAQAVVRALSLRDAGPAEPAGPHIHLVR